MAKESGLNVRLYVSGYDLSGDANSLGAVGYSNETYEVTTLDLSAAARLLGKVDGTMSINGYFDNAANKIHAVLSGNSGKIPTADVNVLVPLGSAIGDPAYGLVAKEAEYNTERSDTGPVTVVSSFAANGYAPEFGIMATAHDDTITASTSGTSVDNSASSSSGGSWYYQVMALSAVGGNARWHLNLQHSTNDSVWTDVSTVTVSSSDPAAARATFTGTLNRYVRQRVVLDASSGSLTYAIAFVRG
jgi:hypothetical protein